MTHRVKKVHHYQERHLLLYGMKASRINPETGQIEEATCQFCIHFGREKGQRKSKKNAAGPYVTSRFTTYNYIQHLQLDHPTRWSQFEKASDSVKFTFFGDLASSENSLRKTLLNKTSQVPLRIVFNKAIIQEIIIDLILNDTIDGRKSGCNVEPFKIYPIDDKSQEYKYGVVVRNPFQFNLILDYTGISLTFEQIAKVINSTYKYTRLSTIGQCSKENVELLSRVICAHCLQMLSDLISKVWAFTISLYTPDKVSQSATIFAPYLQIRLHCYIQESIYSFHVLFINNYQQKDRTTVFNMITKLLDALCPFWRYTLMSVVYEGNEKNATYIDHLMERILHCSNRIPFRSWKYLQQLDQVLEECFHYAMEENFYSHFQSLINHLNQQKIISLLGNMPATVPDKIWQSMRQSVDWFDQNYTQIMLYLKKENPTISPSSQWWIQYFIIAEVTRLASRTYDTLRESNATQQHQKECLQRLLSSYKDYFNIILFDSQQDDSNHVVSAEGKYAVNLGLTNIDELVKDSKCSGLNHLHNIDADEKTELMKNLAFMGVTIVEGISEIVANFNPQDSVIYDTQLFVLPHQLIKMQSSEFKAIIQSQYDSLRYGFTTAEIKKIEQDHQQLILASSLEPALLIDLRTYRRKMTFEDGWKILEGKYSYLKRFAGEMASAFPKTLFTIRNSLELPCPDRNASNYPTSHLLWESILHSKQYRTLQKLCA